MKKRFYEVGQNAIVYGVGNVAQQLIGFLLLPIYTAKLIPAEYGRLALITTLSALLNALLGMGMSTSIFKYFFRENTIEGKRLIASSVFFWLIFLGIFTAFFMFLFSANIADVLLGSSNYANHIRLMTATLVLTQTQLVPYSILRAEKKSKVYAFLTLSTFVLTAGLNIIFVAYMNLGILGILWAGLISTFIFVLVGLYLCRHMLQAVFSWTVIVSMLRYGLPLVPSSISLYILNQADLWFLQHFSTMQEVGVYVLGYKIGSIINMIMFQPIQMIWMPIVYEIEHQPDAKIFYERALTYIFMIGCWGALVLSYFSEEILLLMADPKYHIAYIFVPWVAFAYVMHGAYFIVVIGVFLKGKTSYTIWIVGLAGISNILFNFLLIPTFGAWGAAQSTLISFALLFCITWLINRRIYPLQYEWGRILKIALTSLTLLVAGRYISGSLVSTIMIKSLLSVIYWIVLLALRFYKKEESFWVKSLVKRAYSKRNIKII